MTKLHIKVNQDGSVKVSLGDNRCLLEMKADVVIVDTPIDSQEIVVDKDESV